MQKQVDIHLNDAPNAILLINMFFITDTGQHPSNTDTIIILHQEIHLKFEYSSWFML